MNYQHKNLADGKWKSFSFFNQMGNIWSEIGRCANWNKKGDKEMGKRAFERGLELLDLTIEDSKNKKKILELCLLREMLADHFYFDTGSSYNFVRCVEGSHSGYCNGLESRASKGVHGFESHPFRRAYNYRD